MPKPRRNETRSQFIGRCMSDEEAKKTFPDHRQRVAFCINTWEKSQRKKDTDKNDRDNTGDSTQ